MIRKSIIDIWGDAPAEAQPSGNELVPLIDQRLYRLETQMSAMPVYTLDPADFADFLIVSKVELIVSKVERYREYGIDGCGYDFGDVAPLRYQVLHVIKSVYAVNPETVLSGSIDDISRQIARRIEDALDNAMWEAA